MDHPLDELLSRSLLEIFLILEEPSPSFLKVSLLGGHPREIHLLPPPNLVVIAKPLQVVLHIDHPQVLLWGIVL